MAVASIIGRESPPAQEWGSKNLDSLYRGSDPKVLARVLRVAIWGKDGLVEEMILPGKRSKDSRKSAEYTATVTFLSWYLET